MRNPGKHSMETLRSAARRLRDDRGEDTVEFGLLAALISVAAVITLKGLGPLLSRAYGKIVAALSTGGGRL